MDNIFLEKLYELPGDFLWALVTLLSLVALAEESLVRMSEVSRKLSGEEDCLSLEEGGKPLTVLLAGVLRTAGWPSEPEMEMSNNQLEGDYEQLSEH